MQNTKQTVIAALQAVITNPIHDENEITAFFSLNYQQLVDGNTLDYVDFIKHMATLKQQTKHMELAIKAIVAEGDTVFTHHFVDVEKIQGEKSQFEVFAQFTLLSGKIIRCEELTRMVTGAESDNNLGSRR